MSHNIVVAPQPGSPPMEFSHKKSDMIIQMREVGRSLSDSSETSSLSQEKAIALPPKVGSTWSRYLFCKSMLDSHTRMY